MSSTTGQTSPSPSSPAVANAAPQPVTTMEPKMDAGLLALTCSGSFHDLESFLEEKPAAYTIGSSATQPPSLYAVTVEGDTLLHVVATSHGDSEDLLKKASLVYSKAHSLLFVQNSSGDTPLHHAARAGNVGMVSLLVDLANGQGVNNAKGLLETQNKLKETALHEAVRSGNKEMVNLLMTYNSELATLPQEGTSPLYLAIIRENKVIAKILYELSNGVISYSGPNGQNALHYAVQRSQDLTKMLLEWNNDLTLRGDANGSTPLHFAVAAIQCQIKRDIQPICSQLLKANPDALYQPDHNGSFPTHVAAFAGATQVIKDFLMKSPNCAGLLDARGRTFLHVAVDQMKIEIIDYVCQKISLSWILNMQDKDGNSALHLAVRKRSLQMFCCLFGNGQVQLDLMNEKGETPLDIACHNLPKGMYLKRENEKVIIKVLKYVGAEKGIFHQGVLIEYDTDQARQDEIRIMNQLQEGTQGRCIVSVLIATVTFGAMFTIPGGYRADDHHNAGSPTLAGTRAFNAFIITNILACTFSAMAVICLMFSGDPMLHLRSREVLFERSIVLIIISVASMILALAFGTYTMLAPIDPWFALLAFLGIICLCISHTCGMAMKHIVLFMTICKRKGIWYGLVWAYPFIAFFSVTLTLYILFSPKILWLCFTNGEVEPPAQPPTPFA